MFHCANIDDTLSDRIYQFMKMREKFWTFILSLPKHVNNSSRNATKVDMRKKAPRKFALDVVPV